MTTALSVNLNAVALLRNRRDLPWPDVVEMGRIALSAGADGLTVHPRPDERHIRRSDLRPLSELVAEFPHAELNIEGYPDEAFLELVLHHRPAQATFVPDAPGQATSDHGWDITKHADMLAKACAHMRQAGIAAPCLLMPNPTSPLRRGKWGPIGWSSTQGLMGLAIATQRQPMHNCII